MKIVLSVFVLLLMVECQNRQKQDEVDNLRCINFEFNYLKSIYLPVSVCDSRFSGTATVAYLINSRGEISNVHLPELFLFDTLTNSKIYYLKTDSIDIYPEAVIPILNYFQNYKDSVKVIVYEPLSSECVELNNHILDFVLINNPNNKILTLCKSLKD